MFRSRKFQIFFIIFAFFFSATLSFLITKHPEDTSATIAGFKPGNIINDYTMSNYKTMTEAEIQAWLTAKNPCKNNDYSKYQWLIQHYNKDLGKPTSTHSWHWTGDAKTGHFVCISEERFGDGVEIGVANGETAAHIIYQAAQDYKINPQVLLVLLEKEQGLISDTIPRSGQYRSATGYACPDTAPCAATSYGFKNQIRNAAALFRLALDGNSSYYPVGSNYVLYNPNKNCGGTWVNIENRATGVLYRYTPYQPNAAALSSATGTGDSCSSYGNRNFYHYFTSWFGSTQTEASIAKTQVIADNTYTITLAQSAITAITVTATTDGSNIDMQKNVQANSQKWKVTYNSSDYTYTFINVASGKALDLKDSGTSDGTNIQLYAHNANACAQKWHAVINPDGSYTFLSKCSTAMAITAVPNTGATDNIQIKTSDLTPAQKWSLVPEATITDGVYMITSTLSNKIALDINRGVSRATAGTNVQIYANNASGAQKWQIKYNQNDGTYIIINPHTGLALDVAKGRMSSGTNVQVYTSNGTCAQKWYINKGQNGGYVIASACSPNYVLDVKSGHTTNGTNVQIYAQNQTKAQEWAFTPVKVKIIEEGTYKIIPRANTNSALDISGGVAKAKNGTNIQIYTDNNTDAQKWKVTYNLRDDTYSITNPSTQLSIDLKSAKTQKGTNIQAYTKNGTCAQKWRLGVASDGYYKITSACSDNYVVDVKGAGAADKTNVQLYLSNATIAQEWKFEKLD